MRLIIVHYHLRPGGVRRVIEEAARALVAHDGLGLSAIDLLSGEPPDPAWRDQFQRAVGPTPVRYVLEPCAGYVSEQSGPPARIAGRLRAALRRLLAGCRAEDTVVWAHNTGLGRNLLLVRELERACAGPGIPLIAHHHDWWFDNRWQRWPEFERCGFRTPGEVARVLFPAAPHCGHAAINSTDAGILSGHCGAPVGWLPNPAAAPSAPAVPAERVREARAWLREQTGAAAPVWILPCRLLRRKNVAEALLLARWLRPGAQLVTTGAASSADEQSCFDRLDEAARRHRWPLRLAVMRGDERRKPTVAALLAASEVVMLTSIQEGFGLPFIEAAASRRPLIARRLPNISPDLARFGFRFPHAYDEVLVPPRLFDRAAEIARQRRLLAAWRRGLPSTCRRLAGSLPLLAADAGRPVPFSRLTLTAQLEVLAHPPEETWARCAPLNEFLVPWRSAAAAGGLRAAPWPRAADRWLGGEAYAHRFADLLAAVRAQARGHPGDRAAQKVFIRQRLDSQHLFPLLLSTQS